MTDTRYAEWVDQYVASRVGKLIRGECGRATEEMVAAFPELRRAAGFVHCSWGREEHFWCVAPDGTVVDPTKSQFQLVLAYEELDLSKPEDVARLPTGKDPNCGAEVYNGDNFCSKRCEDAYLRYLRYETRW